MAIVVQNIKSSQIVNDEYLRIDTKYHVFINQFHWNTFPNNIGNCIPLSEILSPSFIPHVFEEGEIYKGIPTGRDYVDEDGYIKNFIYVSQEDCPDRIKYSIKSSNILISSIRQAVTPALCFDSLIDIDNYVFSNGYYIFNVKDGYLLKFVLYLLRSKHIKAILDNAIYRGIGISSYKLSDFLRLKVPNIKIADQELFLAQIKPLETKLIDLKKRVLPDEDIINSVIIKSFNLDVSELRRLDELKVLSSNFNEITLSCTELRGSVRFAKMRLIQQAMIKRYEDYTKLDEYLLGPKTKNGWSPENNDLDGNTKLLGIDSLHFNGSLTFYNPKFTDETREDIGDFYVKNNDFFVSRGNTVDLVALASIAEDIDDTYIYPDIMIKLYVDETKINKQYLAYIFNSIIGRLYFKYASKGKQQTMVKVSSDTICDFIIPKIDLNKQNEIVQEIKTSIDAQKEVVEKIKSIRNKIDSIMEDFLNRTQD